MHPIQEKLLEVIDKKNIGNLTLREIGKLINESLPQKVKHHLVQLERKGFILIDKKSKTIRRSSGKIQAGDVLLSVPIVGAANCGPALIFADENVEGYLKISRRLLPSRKRLYAIRASGNSLNKANIQGKRIQDGDFVIVDSENISPRDGDYVVSVIDGLANIKKYRWDKANSRIALLSESTYEYPPIFLHEDDDFKFTGKVIDVVKNFTS